MAAIRQEELRGYADEARVYEFPTGPVRRRVAEERQVMFLRRRVAAAALVALLVGGGALVLGSAGAPEVTSRPGAPRQVRLERGTTLWQVAERYAPPGTDPRSYIRATLELNGLAAPPHEGARIKLPRSS